MPRQALDAALTSLAALSADRSADSVRRILATARAYLEMDVAFLAEFVDGKEVARALDGGGASFGLEKNESLPVVGAFCRRLVDGRLPSFLADARADALAADVDGTGTLGIGAFIGVPIAFSDGTVFGTLGCLSHVPDPSLSESDVGFLRILARLLGDELERRSITSDRARLELERIRHALDEDSVSIVFQPIVDLRDRAFVGVEALARFGGEPEHSPVVWFEEAEAVGLRTDLELVALRAALRELVNIPKPLYLSLNVSPSTIFSPTFLELLGEDSPERLVVEITEHAPVDDYGALRARLHQVHGLGARVAIDDTGAGFASLANIYRLEPDVIKLDISLTRGIDRDPVRRSLVASLIDFAAGIDASMTAEGIETQAEGEALRSMGVGFGQGWYLGRPARLEEMSEGLASPSLAG
jgi:EAL domain-containing protein (putative c-di-GMP-specific phosphodiesterase class I)